MELSQLTIFLTVASERSFSRAAQKLARTQPAISLAVQRLESEIGEKLLDRSLKDGTLTDAGKVVYEYARKFENLRREMLNSLSELRDKQTGKLIIGANESGALYLLTHIRAFRHLYPGCRSKCAARSRATSLTRSWATRLIWAWLATSQATGT